MKGLTTLGLAKLGAISGSLDDSFAVQVETPGYVAAMARQSDGKMVIGGGFDLVAGLAKKNLARFNGDGTVDSRWNPTADNWVNTVVIIRNAIFVAGTFLPCSRAIAMRGVWSSRERLT